MRIVCEAAFVSAIAGMSIGYGGILSRGGIVFLLECLCFRLVIGGSRKVIVVCFSVIIV